MQKDTNSTTYGDYVTAAKSQNDGAVFPSSYSNFPTKPSLQLAPYPDSPYHSRLLVQDHQDVVNLHAHSLTRLREAITETNTLRQENSTLRSVNRELKQQLGLLIRASAQNQFASSPDYDTRTPLEIINGFRSLSISSGEDLQERPASWDDVQDENDTSVMERVDVKRITLPKSISVRSNGYLKITQGGIGHGGRPRGVTRQVTSAPLDGTQKVFVRGGKKEEEEPLELEVYNQGMLKTELCNKWQETGACPYADNCQFAHGVEELRPVIRHPRYKTEVCRMVVTGDSCPYGHRCHFRHALTEQEKFMAHLKPRGTKLDR